MPDGVDLADPRPDVAEQLVQLGNTLAQLHHRDLAIDMEIRAAAAALKSGGRCPAPALRQALAALNQVLTAKIRAEQARVPSALLQMPPSFDDVLATTEERLRPR